MESIKLKKLEADVQIAGGARSILMRGVAHWLLRSFKVGSDIKGGVGQRGQVCFETLLVQLLRRHMC